MKKIKTALLGLALVAGATGAFVSKISAAPKPLDPIYNWVQGTNDFQGTVSQAESHYGCFSGLNPCAAGTLKPGQSGPPTAEIFHN